MNGMRCGYSYLVTYRGQVRLSPLTAETVSIQLRGDAVVRFDSRFPSSVLLRARLISARAAGFCNRAARYLDSWKDCFKQNDGAEMCAGVAAQGLFEILPDGSLLHGTAGISRNRDRVENLCHWGRLKGEMKRQIFSSPGTRRGDERRMSGQRTGQIMQISTPSRRRHDFVDSWRFAEALS
jgi:hypothetical protein